ncbi:MAG: PAS domain-containing protein [Methanoregulaceae archaeon]
MTEQADAVSRILGVLKRHPEGLNIVEIAEKTGLNRMSAAKYLDVLTANESVESETFGRAKIYTLSRRLPVRAFLEQISKCYCITDSNLRVIQFNHWLPTISDIPPREIEGALLLDIFQDRIVNFGECLAACRKAVAGEAGMVVADDLVGGKHKFLEIYHLPIRFPDGSPGMIAVTQEITDRKLVEIELHRKAEKYQRMVEHLVHVVVETDAAGIISYVSPRAAEWGLLPGNLFGRPFWDLAVPEDREGVRRGLSAMQRSLQGTVRFRAAATGGRMLRLEADCRAIIDASDACTVIVVILRDVTEKDGQMQKGHRHVGEQRETGGTGSVIITEKLLRVLNKLPFRVITNRIPAVSDFSCIPPAGSRIFSGTFERL